MLFKRLLPILVSFIFITSAYAANYDGIQTINLSPNRSNYTSYKVSTIKYPWLKVINYGNADAYYRIGINVTTASTSNTRIPAGNCAVTVIGGSTSLAFFSTGFTTLRVMQADSDISADCPSSFLGNVRAPLVNVPVGNLPAFGNTTGTQLDDSGVSASGLMYQGGPLGTPSSGNGLNITNIPLANVTGDLDVSHLFGGVNATSTNVLYGDHWGPIALPPGSGAGDVTGPGTSVIDNNVVAFNGTSGTSIKDSGISYNNLIVSGGPLGTPSSGNGSNITNIPIANTTGSLPANRGGTGTTTLGTGITSFLTNPSGAVVGSWLAAGAVTSNLGYTPLSVETDPVVKAINGLVKSNGSTISAAVSKTDYAPATTGTANTPLFNDGLGGFANGTRSGNTTTVVTKDASTPATNDCAKWDANGNLTTVGAPCGSGGGSPLTVSDSHGNSVSDVTTLSLASGFTVSGSSGTATAKTTNEVVTQTGTTYTVGTVNPTNNDANLTIHFTNVSPVTITMLDGATLGNGWGMSFICDAGCTINRAGSSSDTINGLTSITVGAKQIISIWSEGTSVLNAAVTSSTDPMNANNLTSGKVGNNQGGAGTLTGVLQATSGVVSTIGLSGSGTVLGSVSGTPVNGNCTSWNNGNLVDAGGPCTTGGGGGTVSSGTANQLAYYGSTGTTVSGNANITDDGSRATISHSVAFSNSASDTISADQNNYAPTGIGTNTLINVDGGVADRTITGVAAQSDGTILTFRNGGTTNNIIFSKEDTSSTAANRFALDSTTILPPNGTLTLRYFAGTVNRWIPWNKTHQEVDYSVGWGTLTNPNKFVALLAKRPMLITGITGFVGDQVGSAATFTVRKQVSGSACSAGTALHTGTFNANGTASTNQILTLSSTALDLQLAVGDRVCLDVDSTSGANMAAGNGNGAIFVYARAL